MAAPQSAIERGLLLTLGGVCASALVVFGVLGAKMETAFVQVLFEKIALFRWRHRRHPTQQISVWKCAFKTPGRTPKSHRRKSLPGIYSSANERQFVKNASVRGGVGGLPPNSLMREEVTGRRVGNSSPHRPRTNLRESLSHPLAPLGIDHITSLPLSPLPLHTPNYHRIPDPAYPWRSPCFFGSSSP